MGRHNPDVGRAIFHDIHENKFDGHESSSGDDHDSDSYMKNSEANTQDLDLEDCNMADIVKQSAELMMPPFESPTHMKAFDLEAISTPKFPEYHLLYANTLRGVITHGEL